MTSYLYYTFYHLGKGDDNHNSVTYHEQVDKLTTVKNVEVEFDDQLTTVEDEEVCRISRYVQS